MSCACKVNRDLEYLHKHYGNKTDISKKEETDFRITEFFKKLIVFIIVLVLLPFIILHILLTFLIKKYKIIEIRKNKWLLPIKV